MGGFQVVKKNIKSLAILSITGLSALFFQCCTPGSSKNSEVISNDIALPVQVVDTATAITERTYLGTIEGKVNVEIRPQIEGILEEIYVDEGAYVEKGQKLFKIDPQTY